MLSKPFALPIRFVTMLLMSLGMLHWSCEENINNAPAKPELSVQQLVNEQTELSTFAAALARVQADTLQNPNIRYTVFAPTDQAFTNYLQANGYGNLAQVPDHELKDLLRYHVALGQRLFTSKDSTLTLTSRSNRKIFVYKADDNLTLNNEAQIINRNLLASNGVVHVIDKVLNIPSRNLGDYIKNRNSDEFNLLVAALNHTNLFPYISSQQNLTLFAPTDAAFEASEQWNSLEAIESADPAKLQRVLLFHMLGGYRFTYMFRQDTVFTQMGKKVALNAANKTVKSLGQENVIPLREDERDVLTGNGVLHAIDALLLPEATGE